MRRDLIQGKLINDELDDAAMRCLNLLAGASTIRRNATGTNNLAGLSENILLNDIREL